MVVVDVVVVLVVVGGAGAGCGCGSVGWWCWCLYYWMVVVGLVDGVVVVSVGLGGSHSYEEGGDGAIDLVI